MEKKIKVARSHKFLAAQEEVTLKVTDKPTDCMQLRAFADCLPPCGSFVCGIDIRDGLVLSNIGIFGVDYEDFVSNVCRYYHSSDVDILMATEFKIVDDPIYEDEYNTPLPPELHRKFCRL